jgi:uncharacterized repeat protein (TIGR02543 family)
MKTLRRLSIGVLLALVTSILTGPPAWADSVYCTTTDSVTGLPTNTGSFTTDSFSRYTYDPYSGDFSSMPTLVTEVTGGTGCAGTAIIPDGVTSIGVLAFSKSELTSITLPSSVTSIDVLAFNNTELTSITLPSSVISIGDLAFYKSKLTSVKFEGEAPTVGGAAFAGIPSGAVAIISPSFASSFGSAGAAWNGLTLAFLRNVNFDANGGTGTMSSQVAAVTTALSTNTFTRDGFAFAGWNTEADGTGEVSYSPGAGYSFASDASLYAQWTAITYSVTFDANGGTGTMSSQVAAVTTALSTNTFTRDGFTFAGWTTAADGTGGSYAPGAGYSFVSDASLYAQWTAIPAPPSPRFSEPAPNPSPLKTTAPEPTPPTQRASTPGGTVADSAEKLIISAGTSGETITARGSDWQLEIASVQGNGKANPATGDSNLVFQPSSKVELSANGLMPSAKVAFWVFSDPTFVGEVETDSTGKFESNLVLPDGLAPGEHTLQVLSRDSKGRAITLNFPILVQGEEAYETASISQKLNAGPFNRSIAVYAKGHKGKTLSWKIAGKWSRKTITSDYQVFQRRTAAVGLDVNVHLYIDGKKQSTMTVRTR